MKRFFNFRYFPEGSEIREFPEAGLVVAVTAAKEGKSPSAIGYFGKAVNPSFNYCFKSTERLEAFILEKIESGKVSLAYKAKRIAEKKAKLAQPNPLATGDILQCTWGYDQTNVDYFQVTRTIGKRSIGIRKIGAKVVPGSEGRDCCRVMPNPGAFLEKSEEQIKRVGPDGHVRIYSFASAHKINPTESTYNSWYA